MTREDFEKSVKELEEIKSENDRKVKLNDEKARMADVNNFPYQSMSLLIYSILIYIILFIISSILMKGLVPNTLLSFVYPTFLIGSSLAMGSITKALIFNKYKIKERFESFSNAKTYEEKLEEEVHYKIEMEKANNRSFAIEESLKVLDLNQKMLEQMSNHYDMKDKIVPKTKEEALMRKQHLSQLLEEKYKKLDVLAIQKVLHDRFWRTRKRLQRIMDNVIFASLSGMFTMFFTWIPLFATNTVITTSSSLLSSLIVFTPFILGSGTVLTFMAKRNKCYKKLFNKINNQLGENALRENLDENLDMPFNEHNEIDLAIEEQIREISLIEYQMQEAKRYLDSYVQETKNTEKEVLRQHEILENTNEQEKAKTLVKKL